MEIVFFFSPISNRMTGSIPAREAHPLVKFIKHEVPFVVCSDNPGLHRANMNEDYLAFLEESGRPDLLEKMYSVQKEHSFLRFVK